MKYLNYAGNIIALSCVIYILIIFSGNPERLDIRPLDFLVYFSGSLILNFFSYIIFYYAFYKITLIKKLGINFLNVLYLFSASNLFRYIPGNVFHYVKRIAIFKEFNLSKRNFIIIHLIELIMVLVTGVIFLLFFFEIKITYLFLSFLLLFSIILFFLKDYFLITILYLCFHILAGLSFIFISIYFLDNASLEALFKFFNIFIVTKTFGIITPGAPSGIGVQELLAFNIYDSQVLLTSLIFHRVSLIIVEISFFIYAKRCSSSLIVKK